MGTQLKRLRDLLSEFGLEYSDIENEEGVVIVLQQGMVKTTGHYGLRAQFLFGPEGDFESHEVIDENPEKHKPQCFEDWWTENGANLMKTLPGYKDIVREGFDAGICAGVDPCICKSNS